MTKLLNKGFAKMGQGQVLASKIPKHIKHNSHSDKVISPKKVNESSGWAIQVGAFSRYKQAYEAAQTAVDYASPQLQKGIIKIFPIKNRKGRILHRSRILGVSKIQAYRACRRLKQKRMNCMEMKNKKDLKVASNN